jgi:transcriptional regulator with XRE-family HTH domain
VKYIFSLSNRFQEILPLFAPGSQSCEHSIPTVCHSGHPLIILMSDPRWVRVVMRVPEESRMLKKAPNPIDRHVGSRVRMRRMMLGMSQEKLGDALGLTFQQVQKYEKGSNRIGASRLQQISLILQVPVSFFFEGAPPPPGDSHALGAPHRPDDTTSLLSTSEGLALARAFTRISNVRLRRRIVDLVEEMAAGEVAAPSEVS